MPLSSGITAFWRERSSWQASAQIVPRLAGLLACGLLAASPGVAQPAKAPLCKGRGLSVEVGFARAGAQSCVITREGGQTQVRLEIRPETTPINPSAWYGVKLIGLRPQTIGVVLDYGSHDHRYHPHVARTIGAWSRVPDDDLTIAPGGKQARLRISLEQGQTFLAGQPFDPLSSLTAFLDARVAEGSLRRTTLGVSKAGIPLMGYQSPSTPTGTEATTEGTVVLLTRQHPPEITGEWAFDAFVGELLGSTQTATAFRARFGVVMVPVMNPDGIARGHWRTNLGLVDLNRDWGPFTQPETQAVSAFIQSVTAISPAIAMIDFHATNRDVIYAQPRTANTFPEGFIDRWLEAWTAALGPSAPQIDRGHNASNANSKTWGRLTLGVAALTYEVGDNTPRQLVEERARLAATLFMAEALALPSLKSVAPPQLQGNPP